MNRLQQLIAELKRRRVFGALVAWGVVCFAVLQVVEPVLHAFSLPDWVLTVVVTVLLAGFPVTTVLAWFFDVTAKGILRTPAAQGDEAGARRLGGPRLALLLGGLGLLAASLGLASFVLWRGSTRPAADAPAPAAASASAPSVAVLPFVNMSDDPANEYFSDGLSEEILNALARIPGLRVPARTSSFAFKGKAEDVGKIGAALRVATILEGSVRKAGGRVRVTAQLVNASDGYHLWSQSFDRELKDVFAIQDEISGAIAEALKLRLAPAAVAGAPQPGSTTNTDAYEAYLLGRHELNQRSRASIESSVARFRKAVGLDPRFAVAYADMAVATLLLARGVATYGDVPMQEAIAQARPMLDKAKALAPNRPEVLAAQGFLEQESGQPNRALELFDRALALNPSNGELHNWRKLVLLQLGRCDQILAASSDAVKFDPLSRIALANYIPMLQMFGRTGEIEGAVERLRTIDGPWAEWSLGTMAMERGDRVEAARHLRLAMQQGRDKAALGLAVILGQLGLREDALKLAGPERLKLHLVLGEYPKALELARQAARQDRSGDATADLFVALYGSGRLAEAAPVAQRLWETGTPEGLHPSLLVLMADAARSAGRAGQAATYRDRAHQVLDLCQRAGLAPTYLDADRATLAAYEGRDDEAVALFDGIVTTFNGSRADVELPLVARLARRADFQAAVKRLDARLADQRRQVLHLLCDRDRAASTWQPAAETCARLTLAR